MKKVPLLIHVTVLLLFSGCSFFDTKINRETIFDRTVSIPKKAIQKIPYFPPLCNEISRFKKGFTNIKDNGKLYYEEEGQGTPIVLINGGPGGTHNVFHPYFSRIKNEARIIYYDQRGTGRSSKDETYKTYTLKQAVDDLETLRKSLKIDRWALLGWSYGGLLAQLYALKYPYHCSALILVAADPGIPANSKPEREKGFISQKELDAMEKILEKGHKGELNLPQSIYNYNLSGNWKRKRYYKPTQEESVRRALYGWSPAPGFRETILSETKNINLKNNFDDFKIPTLIIEGKWELMWWDTNRINVMQKNHPNAQIEVFEKSGHGVFADEPKDFFATLKKFLNKLNNIKAK